MLSLGKKAPEFTLMNQESQEVSLADFKGQKVLIYFYPRASTPGCTVQACGLRDSQSELAKLNVVTLGISPDNGPIFFQTCFFSIQTFTTVGYGTLAPIGIATQIVAAIEAFVGFMSFSLATGLLYGRFSRPRSKLKFADNFVFSKYEDGYSFKFKLTNLRDVVLQDVEAKIITMFNKENKEGNMVRTYYELPITLPKIDIMALTWTLVHKIDKESPFWGKNKEEIMKQHPEFLIFVNGFDEIYSERTRARKSYIVDDIIWNKNFATNFKSLENGKLIMDVRDLNNVIDE